MDGTAGLGKLLRTYAVDALPPVAETPAQTGKGLGSATPAPAAPRAPGVVTELGKGARLLETLLAIAGKEGNAALLAARPALLPAAPSHAPAIAAALQAAVGQSGLFYESHLAATLEGKRSPADLAAEPQGRLAPGSSSDVAPLPQLVRRQLEVLDTRQLQWQGELWPGAQVEMWIASGTAARAHPSGHGADGDGDGAVDDGARRWQSRLRLSLPSLGEVHALLELQGDKVRMELRTVGDDQAQALRKEAPLLAGALADKGRRLARMRIAGNEET